MDYNNLPIEKFKFADKDRRAGDKKLETKPVSYFRDAFNRFCIYFRRLSKTICHAERVTARDKAVNTDNLCRNIAGCRTEQ